jgi:hypothetical protein
MHGTLVFEYDGVDKISLQRAQPQVQVYFSLIVVIKLAMVCHALYANCIMDSCLLWSNVCHISASTIGELCNVPNPFGIVVDTGFHWAIVFLANGMVDAK